MRYCLAALMLFAVLPLMNVLAAPAPAPFAILDVGPPPKGKTAEEYRQDEIGHLNLSRFMLFCVWRNPEVSKLPSLAGLEDARPWLAENLEVIPVPGTDRLIQLKFRAGNITEQVVILKSLLRVYLQVKKERQQWYEEILRKIEAGIPRLAKLIEDEREGNRLKCYQEEWDRSLAREADLRAEIARLKQVAVIRWAK